MFLRHIIRINNKANEEAIMQKIHIGSDPLNPYDGSMTYNNEAFVDITPDGSLSDINPTIDESNIQQNSATELKKTANNLVKRVRFQLGDENDVVTTKANQLQNKVEPTIVNAITLVKELFQEKSLENAKIKYDRIIAILREITK